MFTLNKFSKISLTQYNYFNRFPRMYVLRMFFNIKLTRKKPRTVLLSLQSMLRYNFAQYAANNAKLEAENALNGFRNLQTRRSHCQKLLNSKNNQLSFWLIEAKLVYVKRSTRRSTFFSIIVQQIFKYKRRKQNSHGLAIQI